MFEFAGNSLTGIVDPFGLFRMSKDFKCRHKKTSGRLDDLRGRYNKRAYDAFSKWAFGATKEEVDKALTPGHGPTIEAANIGGDDYAEYDPKADTLYLDCNLLRIIQEGEGDRLEVLLEFLRRTAAHELIHYFEDTKGKWEETRNVPDRGIHFRYDAFGGSLQTCPQAACSQNRHQA